MSEGLVVPVDERAPYIEYALTPELVPSLPEIWVPQAQNSVCPDPLAEIWVRDAKSGESWLMKGARARYGAAFLCQRGGGGGVV